jgi:hypothetical protein
MTVTSSWTSAAASGPLDLTNGQILSETHTDAYTGNFLYLGGPSNAAWVSWTPTLTQGVGVAFTNNWCQYLTIGKLAIVWFQLTASAAGTANTVIVIGGVPAAISPMHVGSMSSLGAGTYLDSPSTEFIPLTAGNTSTTTLQFIRGRGAAIVNDYLGTTAGGGPTIASGDVIGGTFAWGIA